MSLAHSADLQGGWARALAGLIALAAWAGIGVHFHALADEPASWPAALWTLLGYFTITTNLLVAVVFTGVATRTGLGTPWLLGGIMLNILLVGVVYGLLLQGLRELTAGSRFANILLHRVTPAPASVFWLAFVRKGTLTWRSPLFFGRSIRSAISSIGSVPGEGEMTLQAVLRKELYGWPAGDHALPPRARLRIPAHVLLRNQGQPFRTDSLDGLGVLISTEN